MARCKCGRIISRHMKGRCMACRYQEKRQNVQKTCLLCGKPFTPAKYCGQKYCSRKCMAKAQNIRRDQALGRAPTIKACPVCGKEFRATSTGLKKYCSEQCYLKAARKRLKERYREKMATLETRQCLRCGKEFQAKLLSTSQYCSSECRFPKRLEAYQHVEKKPAAKKPKKRMEPIKRGIHQHGIIPRTVGWNSPIGVKEERPAPKCRLKCDPAKLPIRGVPSKPVTLKPPPVAGAYKHMDLLGTNARKRKHDEV